jgi:hypothetical protein
VLVGKFSHGVTVGRWESEWEKKMQGKAGALLSSMTSLLLLLLLLQLLLMSLLLLVAEEGRSLGMAC